MNNSYFADLVISDEETDLSPRFREREVQLRRIIDALRKIMGTKEWSTLKELLFDGIVARLTAARNYEAAKENPDTNRLNRLTGQLLWADSYSDLRKLEALYSEELINVKEKIKD